MMMRIFICLLFASVTVNAQDIDWAKLNSEMQFLKESAFLEKEEVSSQQEVTQEVSTQNAAVERTYTLRRKPKESKDKNILPLEQQFFSDAKFDEKKYRKAPQEPKLEQKANSIKVDGSVPSNF
jgi:hypothetical protein